MTAVPAQGLPLHVAWQQAVAHHQAGRLQQAEQLYRAILQAQPGNPDANHNLGVLAGQAGQHAAGLPYLQAALTSNPAHEQYVLSYAQALLTTGQPAEALAILKGATQRGLASVAVRSLLNKVAAFVQNNQAAGGAPIPDEIDQLAVLFNAGQHSDVERRGFELLERHPDAGLVWKVLGAALGMQGKDALFALENATKYLPMDAEVHNNLGVALQGLGQLDDALVNYCRAIDIRPDYAEAYYNLGVVLKDQGKLDDAVVRFHRALEIKPNFADALVNLGNALKNLDQFESAVASFRRALEVKPGDPDVHVALGNALQDVGQPNEAVESFRCAIEIKPDYAEAHNNLGNSLRDLGRLDNAVASYRQALMIKPDYAEAHNNLSVVLKDLRQLDEAVASCRQALALKSDFAEAYLNLGNVLQDLGQLDDAVASFRRALEINPDYADAHSNLLFALSHHGDVDARALFAEYLRFGEQFEAPLRATWPQHDNSRDPDRPLQIGFVSGDLRNHAVAVFIEPILAHLVGNTQLSLHAYYTHGMEDDVTRRIKGLVAHWHPVVGLSDADLAQRIRADGIDILIDLSGHTAHNRLLAFVRKPAPLQVSWIGYPGTTGLRSMDYYLADRFFLPVEQFADQFTEKIVYLPSTVPFLPFADAPPINPLPALANGYVTFGSFNRTNKISRPVIAMWAELLRAVPDSRMVLGGLAAGSQSENLLTWFDQEGIARERLSGYPRSDMATYLGLHHQVDLCLDTFPYTGGTTTCHALWMGVPTLTLVGKTSFGRDGTGLLSGVGLEAFVAHDAGDFVRKGVAWAQQCEALAAIRSQLRERFAQSPIGQPALVAAGLERALRTMWQRWCAGLPPEHF